MLDYRKVLEEQKKYSELLLRRNFTLPVSKIEKLNRERLHLLNEIELSRNKLKKGSEKFRIIKGKKDQNSNEVQILKSELNALSSSKKISSSKRTNTEVD